MKYIANYEDNRSMVTTDKSKARVVYLCDPNKQFCCNKRLCSTGACKHTYIKERSLDGVGYVTEIHTDSNGDIVLKDVPLHEN